MLLSLIVGGVLKSKFARYSKIPVGYDLTGKEVAERMLRQNGVTGVQVVSVPGMLSDHYNPLNKTVNLSPDVYNGKSISAAAVAAHEVDAGPGAPSESSGYPPALAQTDRGGPVR